MKLVKVLLIILVVLAVIAAGFWRFFLRYQVPFAHIATAYSAKQVCSCRFVAGRDMESCMGDFTLDISAVTISEDDDVITAKVVPLAITSQARFEEGLGCALVKP